ncbi:MAG TPA: hypothetical protein VMR18_00260 [Candidatus Saccharimonadales bacterium]|nr:hypothetical protein [Candidatus Saccharimonadales bacterium]
MSERSVLYIHGLNKGADTPQPFEAKELAAFEVAGINAKYAFVNWARQPFEEAIDGITAEARKLAQIGNLSVVGFSAGGSMAMNVYDRLRDLGNVTATSIAGRLSAGSFFSFSPRDLKRATHYNGKLWYVSCYDSIRHFEDEVEPTLTAYDRAKLRVIKPRLDFVVPLSTMVIEGVDTVTIPAHTHHRAGIRGLTWVRNQLAQQPAS